MPEVSETKVEYIETLALGSSIVCITESHLDENVSSEDIHMDGYHQELYRNDRNCFGGGVLVYVSEILKTKRRFDLEFENGELIWLEIDFPQHKNFTLCYLSITRFKSSLWQNFKHSIEQAYNYTTKIIITGDLNVDLFTEHNHVLNDLMNIFCLQNVVKEATRFDHRSGRATLLDPILISEDCCATFTEVIDINRQMSDHNATKLKECDINTDKARHQLFLQLLSKSSNYNHFNSICDLLQLWPPLKAASSSDHEQNVWVNIFCAMINTTDSKTVSLVVTKFTTICDSVKLDIKCVRHVYNKMIEKKYTIEGVKFVLLSTHKDMLSAAVTELAALDEAKDDEELFDLLLKRSLLPQIVNTVYYKPVVGYLLANQNVEEQSHDYMFLKTVANQLNDNGFKAEAGSLMLQSRSAHSMLQTFGSALGAVGKWLKH
ncbi:Hypothetical predicted protein [Mytilus galloprovincialis]|uniref:Endonuclease/exonuclease/phosphatase domain-containing protein n=1 Tax=Mytilus galloprovincialis TaxID=29158 RepID=A0A8B6G3L6_MYTGA|nr:Hypothetical predicted protein [Mytilus galloprovincialis]